MSKYANKELERTTRRVWSAKNRAKINADAAAWRLANPDKVRAQTKSYNARHKEQIAASRKRWIKNNPDKHRAYARAHYRRNTAKLAAKHKLWKEENKDKYAASIAVWRKANPKKVTLYSARYEQTPERRVQRLAFMRAQREEVSPAYAKALLRDAGYPKEIRNDPDLIAIKQYQVKIHRLLYGVTT